MSKVIDYEDLEEQVFQQQNAIRRNPQSYIPKLQETLKFFRDKILYKPGEDPIQTYEGAEAVEEAIEFLKNQKPVPELYNCKEIKQACRDHCNDIGPRGQTTHEGIDGKNISDRIEKYCEWDGACAENLDFGFKKAENVIMNLLMDDGVKERFQRTNLFHPELKFTGIGAGPHKDYGVCIVIGYARGVRELGTEPTDVSDFIQEYIKNTMGKKNNKNEYQEDDPDAPDNTISLKIEKLTRNFDGKTRKITKKIYTLDNGAQHIVEVEDS